MSAAYVHIPFCSAICPYCDFAVVAGADDRIERYVDAVITEIGLSDPWRELDAVYFGGGTPSYVHPHLLGRVLDSLRTRHGIAPDAEISLEANPEDFGEQRAVELLSAGFTRVSFGAQSFDDGVLASLGRRHRAEDIDRSVDNARRAGFGNVSLDLIFGTPVETGDSWAVSVQRAVDLQPDHVSCYALTVEPGTPLHREVKAGAEAPDPDIQADRYELAGTILPLAGLDRYEVSNWSRPGRQCRYNLVVWAQGEYEAYGNGAHRFLGRVRSHNVRRLEAYMDRVEAGTRPIAGCRPDRGLGWRDRPVVRRPTPFCRRRSRPGGRIPDPDERRAVVAQGRDHRGRRRKTRCSATVAHRRGASSGARSRTTPRVGGIDQHG